MNYDYYGRKPPPFSLSLSFYLSLRQLYARKQRASIAFIFITLRQLLIIRDIDNRFSPSEVVNKKTKKRLKMVGIAFAVSRFGDNAYRRFFRTGNADDNFRGFSSLNLPALSGVRRSRFELLPSRTSISRNFLSLALLCAINTMLGIAMYRKGHAWDKSFGRSIGVAYLMASQNFLSLQL